MPGIWLAVAGRCVFAPVITGMVFDTVASRSAGNWKAVSCWLRVEEIGCYGRVISELDQVMSGQLVLAGSPPCDLAEGMVLTARSHAGGRWERHGDMWLSPGQSG